MIKNNQELMENEKSYTKIFFENTKNDIEKMKLENRDPLKSDEKNEFASCHKKFS